MIRVASLADEAEALAVATALAWARTGPRVLVEAAAFGPTWAMLHPRERLSSAWDVLADGSEFIAASRIRAAVSDLGSGGVLEEDAWDRADALAYLAGGRFVLREPSRRAALETVAQWLDERAEVVVHVGSLASTVLSTGRVVVVARPVSWAIWRDGLVVPDAVVVLVEADRAWEAAWRERCAAPLVVVPAPREAMELALWRSVVRGSGDRRARRVAAWARELAGAVERGG